MVIRYEYLWHREAAKGERVGQKPARPCVVMSARPNTGSFRVGVAPFTHTPPDDDSTAVEVPMKTKLRLGLTDPRTSWIICTELNFFQWPSSKIVEISPDKFDLGLLPTEMLPPLIKTFRSNGANFRRIDRESF